MEKEVSEVERRVALKRTYSDKIDFLLNQEIDDKSFYNIIRRFFAEYLKLDYAFTYEELSQELNKVFIKQSLKSKIDSLLEELSYYEYVSGSELTQEQKKEILSDFKNIIKELITDYQSSTKKSFFEKLFGIKKQTTENSIENKQDSLNKNILNADTERINETKNKSDRYDVLLENEEIKKELEREFSGLDKTTNDINANTNNQLFSEDNLLNQNPKQKTDENKLFLSDNSFNYDTKTKDFDIKTNHVNFLSPEDNDPELIAIKGLMEESYIYLNAGRIKQAKESYLDALKVYNKLNFYKKNIVYLELYELYNKLVVLN
ncbi:MAG: hypothetical protein QXK76_02900 [Candidatus Woesearchaeota archaeon]